MAHHTENHAGHLSRQYSTSDLGIAATLSACGFAVIGISKTNPRRVEFIFRDSSALQEAVEAYWADELKVSASLLLGHTRQLKNRMYHSN